MGLDDVLAKLQAAGFQPVANSDEDFPAFEGEYAVSVKALRPWVNEDTDEKEAYMLQLVVSQTLSGDTADGRNVTRFYRITGNGFDGVALTDEAKADNLRRLINDCYTLGIELDRQTEASLEASFEKAIGVAGFVRTWKAKRRDGEGVSQQFRIKTEADLRKGAKAAKAGTGSRAPF